MPRVSAGGNQPNRSYRSNRSTTGSNNARTLTEINEPATNNSEYYFTRLENIF